MTPKDHKPETVRPLSRLAFASCLAFAISCSALTQNGGGPAASAVAKTTLAPLFIDRVSIYPPAKGHPAVNPKLAVTIKRIIASLPPGVLKQLNASAATVTLCPNIEDKWPGSGDGRIPTQPHVTMGEEDGRVYGCDMHIYERPKVRGKDALGPARSQSEIIDTFFYLMGHTLDDINGQPSTKQPFKAALEKDLAKMPPKVRVDGLYYVNNPSEAFSLVTKVLLSGFHEDFVDSLPNTKAYVQKCLNIPVQESAHKKNTD